MSLSNREKKIIELLKLGTIGYGTAQYLLKRAKLKCFGFCTTIRNVEKLLEICEHASGQRNLFNMNIFNDGYLYNINPVKRTVSRYRGALQRLSPYPVCYHNPRTTRYPVMKR